MPKLSIRAERTNTRSGFARFTALSGIITCACKERSSFRDSCSSNLFRMIGMISEPEAKFCPAAALQLLECPLKRSAERHDFGSLSGPEKSPAGCGKEASWYDSVVVSSSTSARAASPRFSAAASAA